MKFSRNVLYRYFLVALFLFFFTNIQIAFSDGSSLDFKIDLTEEEKAFLSKNAPIRVGITSNWPPLNYLDNQGIPSGLGYEYLGVLNDRLSDVFIVEPAPFHKNFERVKNRQLDAMMDITSTEDREPFFEFSKPYLIIPHVIVARKGELYFSSEKDLKGKIVALEKGYYNINHFQKNHPDVTIRQYESTSDALDAVSRGEADAYVGNRAVSIYHIENELINNIHTHGRLSIPPIELSVGVREDWPILAGIINKALASITEKERAEINAHYVLGHQEPWYESRHFWTVIFISVVVILLIVFLGLIWSVTLRKQVKLRTEALTKENLERKLAEERTKVSEEKYRTLFENASDAIFLMHDEIFIDCNEKTLEMFGCHRDDIIGTQPYKYSPYRQSDGRLSEAKALEKINLALTRGPQFFEWEHSRYDGTIFMTEVSLNRMNLGDKIYLQAIVRDITERKRSEEEFRNLSLHHETLLSAIPDIIMEVDINKTYVWANKPGLDFFGNDVIGREADYYFEGEQDIYSKVKRLFNGDEDVFYVESWQRRRDGEKRLLAWWCKTRKDQYGKVMGAISTARDITDQHIAEEEIKKQKTAYENISNNLGDAMLYQIVRFEDDSRKITYVNEKVKDFYGVTPDELMKNVALLYNKVHPDDRKRLAGEEYKALEKMETLRTEVRMLNPDGTVRWSRFVSVPKKIENGAVLWDGIEFDITERKIMETDLRTANEKYMAIAEDAIDIIFTKDAERRYTYVNPAMVRFLGIPKNDIIGKKPEEVFSDDQTQVINEVDAICYSGKIADVEKELTIDGKKYVLRTTQTPIKDGRGNIIGISGIVKDVTEQKKYEDAIQKALEAKTAFTSMVSHELRTPLTVIKESIYLMLKGVLGPITDKQIKHLEMEKSNVDRLSRLLQQVLDYQALEVGKLQFNMKENNINEVVKDVYSTLVSMAQKKKLELIISLDESLPKFKFDKDRITEVIINLVSNAIKMTEKGNVSITTTINSDFVRISVKDTGVGIKDEDLPRLFKQFEQLNRAPGGTGLGLAISKNIVLAHSGRIWPESVFGKGTTFHFELPVIN